MRAHSTVISLRCALVIPLLGALLTVACAPPSPHGDHERPAGPPVDACASKNEIALHVIRDDDGVADVQTIPVVVDAGDGEQDAWLALDTGSPLTFLFSDPSGPEYVDHAGSVELGCETWDVPGYRQDAIGVEMLEGKPILGIVGIDFFTDGPAEIDYPGAHLTRYFDDAAIPDVFTDASASIPLRGRDDDRPLVDVTIDDTPLTLMFDAGAHDTIWLGVEGGGDDEVSAVQTADGATWQVFVGDGVLALPGEDPRTIPVMRALDIGYIKPELDDLGAQGLFGLTGMGWRRILFDFDGGLMRLGPLQD